MALRALANGDPLDMLSFLLYREYPAPPDAIQEAREGVPSLRLAVHRCPWHGAWAGDDIMEYGRLYCLEIDHAVVRGFGPSLQVDVHTTLSNDAVPCDFVFHGARLDQSGEERMQRGRQRLGDSAIMPWSYHLGHLYRTLREELSLALGQPGREAADAGLAEFATRFGREAAEQIARCAAECDFAEPPPVSGPDPRR
jgi:hypothetical protein